MIKLDEHVVVIDGKRYIPAEIAVQAVIEAIGAKNELQNAFNEIIKTVDSTKTND